MIDFHKDAFIPLDRHYSRVLDVAVLVGLFSFVAGVAATVFFITWPINLFK